MANIKDLFLQLEEIEDRRLNLGLESKKIYQECKKQGIDVTPLRKLVRLRAAQRRYGTVEVAELSDELNSF